MKLGKQMKFARLRKETDTGDGAPETRSTGPFPKVVKAGTILRRGDSAASPLQIGQGAPEMQRL